jgi:hypothetical protein
MFAMIFKCFPGVFASRDMFQVFHPSFLYVEVLHLNVSKVDRGVTHGIRVGKREGARAIHCACWRRRCPGWRGPAAGVLTHKSDAARVARLLHGHRLMLALQIGRPGVSKSDLPNVTYLHIYRPNLSIS